MVWYNFIACFFAGAFFANAIPHFVYGVCGDKFPTPFANPPGKGLSSAFLNVLWALLNFVIAAFLVWGGKVSTANIWNIIVFFLGLSAMSIMLSFTFSTKITDDSIN